MIQTVIHTVFAVFACVKANALRFRFELRHILCVLAFDLFKNVPLRTTGNQPLILGCFSGDQFFGQKVTDIDPSPIAAQDSIAGAKDHFDLPLRKGLGLPKS